MINNYKVERDFIGNKFYLLNNKLHREDGPAAEYVYGRKEWYKNGLRHRKDGPAIEYANGLRCWYLNDKCYGYDNDFTNESWYKFVKTLIFS